MALAYECDRCKLTFLGEAKETQDLDVLGTAFVLRFSFGKKREEDEQERMRQSYEEQVKGLGPFSVLAKASMDEDRVALTGADLCGPCRVALLSEALDVARLVAGQ